MSTYAQILRQQAVDAFYAAHGPCCAGCDWWRFYNSLVGECIRSAPVSGAERVAMLGIDATSLVPGAGHVMTRRDHHCGEFRDEQEQQAPERDSPTPQAAERGE